MANDLTGFREALKLLNNKLDALVKTLNQKETQVSEEDLNKFMVQNNVDELTRKISDMVKSGLLAASDTVTNGSFVVINEQGKDGTILNPRMQFVVSALQHEEVRSKLEGSKVGANIPVGDQGGSINVLESYDVVAPAAPEATATPAVTETTPATSTDSAAPAAEAPATLESASAAPAEAATA